ncbi:Alcohol dehydrogenase superfamily zinc-type [Penicillium chermesinum]|uniref:Alcohol dehydrogenase superfamily zinc-type n=1 Tax=Penicillium chermesinum TaxID=63820 RepID=A0A9W9TSU9_9EURO|nr:Alcohol dehydrogenase superfamily zinc-type [Penicillium chermesinum]KAJ5238299.1 Alcohol dehydrogenase superfamily zinc-type [Penicillium chermesinum]KAJ6163966.1 Alcohol dehydrogenase superfamily zinc-type [Penicillium chermesinum]
MSEVEAEAKTQASKSILSKTLHSCNLPQIHQYKHINRPKMKSTKFSSYSDPSTAYIPSVMRALYYSPSNSMDMESLEETPSPGTTISTVSQDVDTGTGLMLDTTYPTPTPTDDQYLIKVQTAAFCHDEIRLAQTLNPKNNTPKIPLHSTCGTVVTTPHQDPDRPLGPRFHVGDVVFGVLSYTRDGAAADYVIAYEGEITLKPRNISASKAAALALPALTAWQALFKYAGLDPDAVARNRGYENLKGANHEALYGYGYGNGHTNRSSQQYGSQRGSGMIPSTNGHANGSAANNGRKHSWASTARASIGHLIGVNSNRSSTSSGSGRASSTASGNAVMNGYANGDNGNGSTGGPSGAERKLSWANMRRVSLGSTPGGHNGNGIKKKKSEQLRVVVTNVRDNEIGRIAVELLRAEKLFPQDYLPPWICVTCTPTEEAAIRTWWNVDEVLIIPDLPTSDECDFGAMFRERRWEAVDIVLDCIGGEAFRQAHAIVRDEGTVLTAVDPWPAQMPADTMGSDPLGRRKRRLKSQFVPVSPDGKAMGRIAELVEDGTVTGREEVNVDLLNAAKLLDSGAAGAAGARRGVMMSVRISYGAL